MNKKSATKSIWGIVLVGIAAFLFWYLFIDEEKLEVEYRQEEVQNGDISVVVTATGLLEAVTTVQVGSQVSGTISALYADYNTIVKSGDVVAQIDPTFLEAQVKEQAASIERLKALEDQAKRDLDVAKTLYEKSLLSKIEYDAKITALDVAKANRVASEASLERARVNLRYATIRAPIDGVVISRNVDIGQTVAASFSAPVLFQIANDLTKMQVKASIDEADIGKVNLGQPVSFTVDAFPDRRFSGRVSEVRLEPIDNQNVVTYNVIIDVPNEDLSLMPGMTANVSILIERKKNILRIPARALKFVPPDTTVIIKDNYTFKRAPKRDDEFSAPPLDSLSKGRKRPQDMNRASAGSRAPSGQEARQQPAIGGNPFAGMSREEIRAKLQSMSPEERQALREKFGSFRRGGNTDFSGAEKFAGFERNQMRSGQPPLAEKPVRQLTQKWNKTAQRQAQRNGFGFVWVLTPENKLRRIPVETGLSDGMFTEIQPGALKAGEKVVIMAIIAEGSDGPSPLPGSSPQSGPGGGPGGRRGGF